MVPLIRLALVAISLPSVLSLSPIHHRHQLHTSSDLDLDLSSDRPSYNFSVPVDHFHNDSRYEPHSDDTFPLRYWLDDRHYAPGGPVIMLAAGEVTGAARLPFLEHGIVSILAEALGGLGVVLEHRYYGTSYPVSDLSTENLRFLSTDQALADTAYFAQNIRYPGLKDHNLTAADAPYILYGGSYAGAFVSLARKLYPDVFWGAISSSGVTAAVDDFWEYHEAARLYSPGNCAANHQRIVGIVDNILIKREQKEGEKLKAAFGLEDLDDQDFVEELRRGISGLQSVMWDPAENNDDFARYCGILTADAAVYPNTRHLRDLAEEFVRLGFYVPDEATTTQLLNFMGYIQSGVSRDLRTSCRGKSVRECYGQSGLDVAGDISIPQSMIRPWVYQTCTQWGYFITGAGTPADQPAMISRLIDYDYATLPCRTLFNITTRPDIDSINALGGFNFSYPRVALVDGEADPWRQATPHALGLGSESRRSTVEEPFLLIGGGATHHWDEYGLGEGAYGPGLPPKDVKDVQEREVGFARAWVEEWEEERGRRDEAGMPGEL